MNYSDPSSIVEAGRNAFKMGLEKSKCPISRRTNANAACLWDKGWNEESASTSTSEKLSMTFEQLQSGIKHVYSKWYEYLAVRERAALVENLNNDLKAFENGLYEKYGVTDVPNSLLASAIDHNEVVKFSSSLADEMLAYGEDTNAVLDGLQETYSALVKEYTDAGGKGFYDVVAKVMTISESDDLALLMVIGQLIKAGGDIIIVDEAAQPDRALVSDGLSVSKIYSVMLPSSHLSLFKEFIGDRLRPSSNKSFCGEGMRVYNHFILPDLTFGQRDTVKVMRNLIGKERKGGMDFCYSAFADCGYGISPFSEADGSAFDLSEGVKLGLIGLAVYDDRKDAADYEGVVAIDIGSQYTIPWEGNQRVLISCSPKYKLLDARRNALVTE